MLDKGARNVELLKQNEGSPLPVEDQIAVLYIGTKGLIGKVPLNKVKAFEEEYLALLNANHRGVLDAIKSGNLSDEPTDTLRAVCVDLVTKY